MSTNHAVSPAGEPMVVSAAEPHRRGLLWAGLGIGGAVVLGLVAWLAVSWNTGGGNVDLPVAYAVQGDLQITVVEDGELEAYDYYEIKCEVPGGSTIKTIHVKNGQQVKVDDPLFDLDTEQLENQLRNQELDVENALAALEAARKDLDIQIKQNQSAKKKAEDAVELARLDKEKYLLGEYPIALEEAKLAIDQAQRRLDIAEEDLKGSLELVKEGFVTQKEVDQNKLAVADAKFNHKKALNDLKLLEDYTYHREKRSRESKHDLGVEDLARVLEQNANEEAKVQREVKNREFQYGLKNERLTELKENQENSIVKADRAGTVYFNHGGHRWRRVMIEEGADVREGQVIMKIPDTSRMLVKFTISERDRYRVQEKQPAVVTVATMPNVPLYAMVTKKSPRPDDKSWFENPDVKLFACEALLNEQQPEGADKAMLAPNTSAKIRIFIGALKNVIHVPVQAVYRVGAKTMLATLKDGQPALIDVEVGQSNEDFIQIKRGVEKDQPVLLALSEPLKQELQILRDKEAKAEEANNGPPEGMPQPDDEPAQPQAPGAAQRPGGPEAGLTLTDAERDQMLTLFRRFRDPANQTPEKRKALLDGLPSELRKKLEPMIQQMLSGEGRPPGGRSRDGQGGTDPGRSGRSSRRPPS